MVHITLHIHIIAPLILSVSVGVHLTYICLSCFILKSSLCLTVCSLSQCVSLSACDDHYHMLIFKPFSLNCLQFIADHVETNSLFHDDKECQQLIMEALKYHLLPERRSSFQSPRTKPRKSTVGVLYAVGSMECTKGLFVYHFTCLSCNFFYDYSVFHNHNKAPLIESAVTFTCK